MAKKKGQPTKTINDAKKYYRYLLYISSNGNLGDKPELEATNDTTTFAEKRGLLDSIIKISDLENRMAENEEPEAFFDKIKEKVNVSATAWSRGNTGGSTESFTDEPTGNFDTSGKPDEAETDAGS